MHILECVAFCWRAVTSPQHSLSGCAQDAEEASKFDDKLIHSVDLYTFRLVAATIEEYIDGKKFAPLEFVVPLLLEMTYLVVRQRGLLTLSLSSFR